MNVGAQENNDDDLARCEQLFSAVRRGKLDQVKQLIDTHGIPMVSKPFDEYYLLREATKYNRSTIAQLLLTKGCSAVRNDTPGPATLTPLHFAVIHNDLSVLKMLLDRNVDMDAADSCGKTALHYALEESHNNAAELLLHHGANVNAVDSARKSPLFYTLCCSHVSVEMVKKLLISGANIDPTSDFSPLHKAVEIGDKDIVELLISHDADVNFTTTDGVTALVLASRCGHKEIAEILVNCGANVNVACVLPKSKGYTPLHFASKGGNTELVKLLLSNGADVNVMDSARMTPLHFASKGGNVDLVKLLVSNGADIDANSRNNLTPIYLATTNGHGETVRLLLELGADVNAENNDGKTILLHAVRKRNLSIVEHILQFAPDANNSSNRQAFRIAVRGNPSEYSNIVRRMLQCGITVLPAHANDVELLWSAVANGYVQIVERFLSFGVDVNMEMTTGDAFSLLHCAVKRQHEDIVRLLINCGADVNAKGLDFASRPLRFAMENEDLSIFKLLYAKGAYRNYPTLNGVLCDAIMNDCESIVEFLLHSNPSFDVNVAVNDGRTALHFAAMKSRPKGHFTAALIAKGANVNAKTCNGSTALHLAAGEGCKLTVETLLRNGAAVNSVQFMQRTALHLAAEKGNCEVAEILLRFRADVDRIDKDGKTVLHIACANRFTPPTITEILLRYDCNVNILCNEGLTPLDYARMAFYYWHHGEESLRYVEFMKQPLTRHLIKRRVAGLPLCNSYADLLPFRVQSPALDSFVQECQKEIEALKKLEVHRGVTLHDILVKNLNVVAVYSKKQQVRSFMEAGNYKTEFPNYADLIRCHVNKGLERAKLLKSSRIHFDVLCGFQLPCLVADKMTSLLSNRDLRCVADAVRRS